MEVVRCESVPLMVRSAFAQLVLNCHLDVAPLLPRHPVRYGTCSPECTVVDVWSRHCHGVERCENITIGKCIASGSVSGAEVKKKPRKCDRTAA